VILNYIRLLLLALWLGAAMFFSSVVAPAAFAVLRAYLLPNPGEIAGTIVNRNLAVINTSGFIIGVVLLLTGLVLKRIRSFFLLELVSLAVVALATGLGQWVIAARLHSLRVAMAVPIDQVPAADPRRIAFDSLHAYSVTALSVAMIAGLIAFFVMAYRARLD
jgi:Domain of unknown function (DUF4149)